MLDLSSRLLYIRRMNEKHEVVIFNLSPATKRLLDLLAEMRASKVEREGGPRIKGYRSIVLRELIHAAADREGLEDK